MAASQLLPCLILCAAAAIVYPQTNRYLYRLHVSEEGRSVTLLCPPHDEESYTSREWRRYEILLRPRSVIYQQDRGGAVDATGARPDMSLNMTDGSLTIGSLQAKDTGRLYCRVTTGGQTLDASTDLLVYNRRVDVRNGTSVTLQCPVAAGVYSTRQWYTQPLSTRLIYNQTTSGVTQGPDARDDMSLDTRSFNLTVGNVRQDDIIFICIVTSQQTTNAGIIFTAIYNVVLEAEERTSVTLPCNEVKRQTSLSTGDYTRTWQRVDGVLLYYQQRFIDVFYQRPSAARADMSLNNATFALTIRNVQLEDNIMFFCTYFEFIRPALFESVKLLIYINPNILLHGLDDTPVSVGTTVTVTCTIDRVYPELGPADFRIRWGTQTMMSTGSQNNDSSYSYTVQYTHNLTNDDDGTVVECSVNPQRGKSDSISKIILLNAPNQSPSSLLPVIGGAVAAAAVVIIIVVVIVITICVRRKAQDNKVTDQTGRTGESHDEHGMVTPYATIRDETYLPGADYHEYHKLDAIGDALPSAGVVRQGTYLHPPEEGDVLPSTGVVRESTYLHLPGDGPSSVPFDERQYEKLKPEANTPIDKWFKDRDIPKSTAKKLKRQHIITLDHLQDMSHADMVETGLSVGERNRISKALKKSGTSQF